MLIAGILAILIFTIQETHAFTGPVSGAGVGSGAIGVDAANNISIGTSTPAANTKLLIVASSTDTTNYALRVLQPTGNTPIIILRNDGSVGIGTASPTATYILDVNGNTRINGVLNATSYTGFIAAANVTAGVFGVSQSSSPYAFPASLGIATSTQANLPQALSVYGGGYFSGNVGIGTASPGYKLDVAGGNVHVSGGNNFINGGFDFVLGIDDQVSRGNSGTSRALVKNSGSILYVNYAGDFTGGTQIGPNALIANSGASYINTGNVGIGTASPSYKLDVVGTARFSQPVEVGYPTANTHAATRAYVDAAVLGGHGMQTFTANGTWVRPTGVNVVWVTLVGGGGGATNWMNVTNRGGGGGAGQALFRQPVAVSVDVSVTVGAGGAGGSSGGTGGTSSFGSLSAAGGGGGSGNTGGTSGGGMSPDPTTGIGSNCTGDGWGSSGGSGGTNGERGGGCGAYGGNGTGGGSSLGNYGNGGNSPIGDPSGATAGGAGKVIVEW